MTTRAVAAGVFAAVLAWPGAAFAQPSPDLTVTPNPVAADASITVAAGGFAPASLVAIDLLDATGAVTRLNRVTAGADGAVATTERLPSTVGVGDLTVELTGTDRTGALRTLTAPISVRGPLTNTGTDVTLAALVGLAAVTIGVVCVDGELRLRYRELARSVARSRPRRVALRPRTTQSSRPGRIRIRPKGAPRGKFPPSGS